LLFVETDWPSRTIAARAPTISNSKAPSGNERTTISTCRVPNANFSFQTCASLFGKWPALTRLTLPIDSLRPVEMAKRTQHFRICQCYAFAARLHAELFQLPKCAREASRGHA